ncbi:hypothetical protein EI94DRAFT_1814743 [Lactarius quietus]|nr:hypothetical protein EI94DRAFT_1814743 [Lactarius quietus]
MTMLKAEEDPEGTRFGLGRLLTVRLRNGGQLEQYDSEQLITSFLQSRWLNPTFNVLYAFSATLGGSVGLVFLPAQLIFSGVVVLLSAAMNAERSQDALVDIFDRIENSSGVSNIIIEVLNVFAIATKEMKQGRAKKYLKRLIGEREIEDALNRLDKLTQEKARMAAAEVLRLTQIVDNQVTTVISGKSGKLATRETSF